MLPVQLLYRKLKLIPLPTVFTLQTAMLVENRIEVHPLPRTRVPKQSVESQPTFRRSMLFALLATCLMLVSYFTYPEDGRETSVDFQRTTRLYITFS
jgi:hypothetical protein